MNLTNSLKKLLCNRKHILLSIVLVSLLTQSLFLYVSRNVATLASPTDYIQYYKPGAENIMSGSGYIDTEGEFIVRYPPGFSLYLTFPLFIAKILSISDITVIKFFSIITLTLSTVFFFLFVERIFKTRIAFFSSLIWITYPFHLWLIKIPFSTTPFLLFLFSSLWLLYFSIEKDKLFYLFLAGIFTGFAILIRPVGLFLGFIFIIQILSLNHRKGLTKIIPVSAYFVGMLLTILPWEIRVYNETGEIIPISKNGPASIINGITFALNEGPAGDKISVPEDVLDFMKRSADNKNLITGRSVLNHIAKEIRENPATIIKLVLIKMKRAWYATSAKWYEEYIMMIQAFYFMSILSGIILVFKKNKNKIRSIIFLFSIVAYFWGMSLLVEPVLRYMVPGMALLLVFSAVTFERIIASKIDI